MVDLCADPLRYQTIRRAVSTESAAVSDLTVINVDKVINVTRISSIVRLTDDLAPAQPSGTRPPAVVRCTHASCLGQMRCLIALRARGCGSRACVAPCRGPCAGVHACYVQRPGNGRPPDHGRFSPPVLLGHRARKRTLALLRASLMLSCAPLHCYRSC